MKIPLLFGFDGLHGYRTIFPVPLGEASSFVVSDYTAITELIAHGLTADGAEAARAALEAGVDMEMVSRLYNRHLLLVREGALSMAAIDNAVRRVAADQIPAGTL